MKVIFHKDFYDPYTSDPAAAAGRMEAVIEVIESEVEFVTAEPAVEEDIAAVHRLDHVEFVRSRGLYSISALAAEGRCFGILEGGYNHQVLGLNVLALIEGLSGK